eukprot:gnl/TRDRNA2_/TRDRNA2_166068_c0_seq2.p4 gnl/TRDRNA2_/TRDRNA2_166068_c0~~gnl/TRDRNA2_/TRDRNA2_166068_c0_seq2.p4  ORF type:complete len:123 (-),score=32.47 gnl/TRDRNA2_/TRDRNA2_166068_c0_seq2:22-390(-)
MAIVSAVIPFIMEDDIEPWQVQMWVIVAAVVAVALLIAAFMMPAQTKLDPLFEQRIAALSEQERFVELVKRQRMLWTGEAPEASATPETSPSAQATPAKPVDEVSAGPTRRTAMPAAEGLTI